jgi:outer membrane protein, heavy metal efflux system
MRLAACALAITFAALLSAQNVDVPRLQLEDIVAEAVRSSPEILAAQKKYEAFRQRPAQDRALPDPTVSFGWNANGNPLPGAGLGTDPTSNIGGMISQEVPYPGKLRLRGQIASKEADAEAQQFRAVELNVISRLKQAYYRLQHAYAMHAVLERNAETIRTLLRVTEARYSIGKAAQADVFRGQTQLTMIEARIIQIDRERHSREAEINSILNRRETELLAPPNEPHMMPLAFTYEELMAKTGVAPPALVRDQRMIERAQTALSLAKKDSYPDFAVNGGYYYMGSMPAMYMVRADMKLPIRFGKLHAEVSEKSQQLAEAKHSYEATARSLEYRIKDEYLAAETAHKLAELYEKTAIPQARLAVDSSLVSYQTGAIDFTAVLSNAIAAFDYEMNYHEQMQEFHLALARLEELTGVELTQ